MYKYNIAILVDNFQNTGQTQSIIKEILDNPQYDCTIFTISKENIISNPLAVFSIADYFNWEGVSLITSPKTLEKAITYPAIGPKIILGKVKYQDYLNIDIFKLDLIDGVLHGYEKNVG